MYVKKKITTIFCLCFSVSSLFAALSNISVILIMLWRRKYVNGIWLDKIRVTRFIFVLWHLWLFSMTLAFFLFWCNFLLCFILFWLRLFQPPPFSEPSFSLSMRSWAVTLFSEYPLLFSVATPADKHVARYPDGHPPPAPRPQMHAHADPGMDAHACSAPPPSPRELKQLQLFSGLGSRSSRRASHVSSLTGTNTNNAAAAKEGFKSPGLKRRPLNSGEMVEPDASGCMNRSEGKEPELGFLHLKRFAPVVDSHILIFQDSAQVAPLSEAFPDRLTIPSVPIQSWFHLVAYLPATPNSLDSDF